MPRLVLLLSLICLIACRTAEAPPSSVRPPAAPATRAPSAQPVADRSTLERRRVKQLRERIVRLYNEANLRFRREEYATAASLYREILRLDPANRDAVTLAELARRSHVKKLANESRRELIEQWLRATEETDLASLPMTALVRFPDADTWREVSSTTRVYNVRDLTQGPVRDFMGPDLKIEVAQGAAIADPVSAVRRRIVTGLFVNAAKTPRSTFSADVDTAAYAIVRQSLLGGTLPPAEAVRIEELINYFSYDYRAPAPGDRLGVDIEVAGCPWRAGARVVRIGLHAPRVADAERPACNLVFLIDVSGSMSSPGKLDRVQRGLKLLVDRLDRRDTVAIVVYAGHDRLALPPTRGDDRQTIRDAIDAVGSGGGTNGEAGIRLAYQIARGARKRGGVNRVILATDGDFNVGVSDTAELVRLIEHERKSGVFLTVLGVGQSPNDLMMETLSNAGNGNYAVLDSDAEARRVLVEQSGSTLVTVASDVKLQVAFDPARVVSYRLIGYDNRRLADRDFADDRKDAGEIGAGHTVTALYEVVPKVGAAAGPLLTFRLRYKVPGDKASALRTFVVHDRAKGIASATADFKFALAVAELGMLLRASRQVPPARFARVVSLARAGLQPRPDGPRPDLAHRQAFIGLVEQARTLVAAR